MPLNSLALTAFSLYQLASYGYSRTQYLSIIVNLVRIFGYEREPDGLTTFCGRHFLFDKKSSPKDIGCCLHRAIFFATIPGGRKPTIDAACAARVEFIALYSYQLGKPCERRMPCEANEAEADKKRMLFDEADVS